MSEVHGWDAISAMLEVSNDTAQRYASRQIDPLPVLFKETKPFAPAGSIEAWMKRHELSYHNYQALRNAGLLPSQREPLEGGAETMGERRSKVATDRVVRGEPFVTVVGPKPAPRPAPKPAFVLGPSLRTEAGRRIKKKAAHDISRAVYLDAAGCRAFAERVARGCFGEHDTMVYFMGSGSDGPIKIGMSFDPDRRVKDIQTASPEEIRVLAQVSGDQDVERMFHGVFAPDHIRGEWFKRSPTLLEFIRVATLKAKYPDG
jgi:hypothetical protein